MLSAKSLHKSFDGIHAVDDLTLTVNKGQITSLIGPNGAGKTTVFNILTGYLAPDVGTASFEHQDLIGPPPYAIARMGIARTFQNLRLLRKMTVKENVMLGIQGQKGESMLNALVGFSRTSSGHAQVERRASELLGFVGLSEKSSDLAENLSYGQQKLLSIACCLAADPKLLLLDEPVSGVQPEMIEKIESILRQLVEEQGKAVFLIEHDIDFVLRLSDRVIVMDDGKMITDGPPSDIKDNTRILEAYLS